MFVGVCSGDSGGPLVKRMSKGRRGRDDIFVLLGIVSKGTRVSARKKDVTMQLRKNNSCYSRLIAVDWGP